MLRFLFIIIIDYAPRKAIENSEDLGFTLVERKSRKYPPQRIMVTDFADDIGTFSETLQNAVLLLQNIKISGKLAGKFINKTKTEFILSKMNSIIQSLNGVNSTDYKYLG